ncbi:MAG: YbaN family protein [Elusimicrobiales bacterium]|nr:YbaN family protein [Elusimicrobiales bacterium]
MVKFFLFLIATLSLITGIIAIFIPLIPTTPFLLLSSYLYLKSSTRAYEWLTNSRYIGKYIKDYKEQRKIPIKVKIFSILLLCVTIITSIIFFTKSSIIRFILILIMISVTIHILMLKTTD